VKAKITIDGKLKHLDFCGSESSSSPTPRLVQSTTKKQLRSTDRSTFRAIEQASSKLTGTQQNNRALNHGSME
jgi:hypothetical protein